MSESLDTTSLTVLSTTIRRDGEGRYCLNDCHRAAGGDNAKRPSLWAENAQTKALIAELEGSAGIPAYPINTVTTGHNEGRGTYVAKELVYAYAMWISPAFHLTVIRAFDAMVTRPAIDPMAMLGDPAAMRGLLLIYTEKVIALEASNAALMPKASAHDRIAAADGSLSITEAAKALQARPKDLFEWMSSAGWIYRRAGSAHWLGYQSKTTGGDLEHKVTTVLRPDGSEKVTEQVRVTPKGLTKLARQMPGRLQTVPSEGAVQ